MVCVATTALHTFFPFPSLLLHSRFLFRSDVRERERQRERVGKKEWETHKKGERRRGCRWPKAALRPIHMQMAEGASTNPWEDESYASSPSSPLPVPPPSPPSLSEPFSDLAVSHSSLMRGPFEQEACYADWKEMKNKQKTLLLCLRACSCDREDRTEPERWWPDTFPTNHWAKKKLTFGHDIHCVTYLLQYWVTKDKLITHRSIAHSLEKCIRFKCTGSISDR